MDCRSFQTRNDKSITIIASVTWRSMSPYVTTCRQKPGLLYCVRNDETSRNEEVSLGTFGLAHNQAQCEQRESHKEDERPIGQRATQKRPVNFATVTAALENHRYGAPQWKAFNHSVKIATTTLKLGWIPLQPALRGRHIRAEAGAQQQQCRGRQVNTTVSANSTCNGENRNSNHGVALNDAHRARFNAESVLQVLPERQHAQAHDSQQGKNTPWIAIQPDRHECQALAGSFVGSLARG